ncbi:MAG: low-complexity tail membrane protein [Actinomycetota bacterium]
MRYFWSDPYLWIHLAGVATLPLMLGGCLLGLAVGSPVLPVWLELGLVAVAGIAPVLWMQWVRPFYIFSFLVVALRPEKLTALQQRLLTRFKTPLNQGLTLVVPVVLAVILWQLYRIAPLAAQVAPFPPHWRVAGLLLAAVAFLGSNLFLQVPTSVVSVLLTSEAELTAAQPYDLAKIRQDFTILGWQVSRILPPVEDATMPATPAVPPVSASLDTDPMTSTPE